MVNVDFKFTEEHFATCCARYRQSGRKRWFTLTLRIFASAACIYQGYQCFQHGQMAFVIFFGSATLFFLFFPQLMNFIAKAQHRRSPYRNEDVHMEFTEEGVEIKSPTTDVQCRWSAFTAVTEFSDGLLLFRGPLFHWVSGEIVTSDGGIRELQRLTRENVSDYSVRSALKT